MSDDITLTDVIKEPSAPEVTKPDTVDSALTEDQIKAVYPYLQWLGKDYVPAEFSQYAGLGYFGIAEACGVSENQVRDLHAQYLAAIAPEPVAPAAE